MMTKQLFISLIEALRDQSCYDNRVTDKLWSIYDADINPYDNSTLRDAIFLVLENYFPDKIGCIKIFCYELDYGKNIKTEGCAIEELWLELEPCLKLTSLDTWYEQNLEETKKIFESKIPIQPLMGSALSTHPLIDDLDVAYEVVSPLPKKQ